LCEILLDAKASTVASMQVTFNRKPPLCIVPNVKSLLLGEAKARIRNHDCGFGKVRRTFSLTKQKGRVISQTPVVGWRREQGAKVNLLVGKGRR
jgi:beta-lactam-binding protein with PASTA domain